MMPRFRIAAAVGLGMLAVSTLAVRADDTLKIAVGQRGSWDTSVSELGQKAGIFKKHGLELDLLFTQGAGETQQATISGSVDIGIGGGVMGVLGAFEKGAPIRVIGTEVNSAGDYWYVAATSAIKTIKDANGATMAYSTNGSSTHAIVLAIIKEYGLTAARPVATNRRTTDICRRSSSSRQSAAGTGQSLRWTLSGCPPLPAARF